MDPVDDLARGSVRAVAGANRRRRLRLGCEGWARSHPGRMAPRWAWLSVRGRERGGGWEQEEREAV